MTGGRRQGLFEQETPFETAEIGPFGDSFLGNLWGPLRVGPS